MRLKKSTKSKTEQWREDIGEWFTGEIARNLMVERQSKIGNMIDVVISSVDKDNVY